MEKLFGKYRGEVINNKDEEKRGRVLVKVPSLGDVELGWAEACLPPSTFAIPQRGDFVWLEFEEGDIDNPIWVGILPTNDYFKILLEGFPAYDPTSHIVKPKGNFNVDSGHEVNLKAKTKFTTTASTSATINGGGAVNVVGGALNNSAKWSIDDIGAQ